MAEHAQEQITSLLYFRTEKVDRLGDGLIDRFVEPDDVVWLPSLRTGSVGPQAKHARSQRAILRHKLVVEAALGAEEGVGLCGCLRRAR
jgi:hypothetical protein